MSLHDGSFRWDKKRSAVVACTFVPLPSVQGVSPNEVRNWERRKQLEADRRAAALEELVDYLTPEASS